MGAGGRQQERDDNVEEAGSLRRCILTRVERDPADLVRFVADPEGRLVPDLSRKLQPAKCVGDGRQGKRRRRGGSEGLAKSLKRASCGLRRTCRKPVEALFVKRVLEALSLANKAGLVATGFEKVEGLISGGRAAALLQGSDAAEDGKRKLDRKLRQFNGIAARPPPLLIGSPSNN